MLDFAIFCLFRRYFQQKNVLFLRGGGGIVAKYAKTIGFGKTIFAFLMLNTMSPAHNKIFGAKFLSFERLEAIRLYTVSCAVFLRIVMKSDSQKSHFLLQ